MRTGLNQIIFLILTMLFYSCLDSSVSTRLGGDHGEANGLADYEAYIATLMSLSEPILKEGPSRTPTREQFISDFSELLPEKQPEPREPRDSSACDVDRSERITMADVHLTVLAFQGYLSPRGAQLQADVNSDGRVDFLDVFEIIGSIGERSNMRADVTGDDRVTLEDATLAIMMFAGELEDGALVHPDVDGNGESNMADTQLVLQNL